MHSTLTQSWQKALAPYLITSAFQKLMEHIRNAYASGKIIYPPQEKIFHAFNSTALNSVKIVILGQDPYHGKGQAQGLAFSVPDGVTAPPSLRNIFKEINTDVYQRRQGSPSDIADKNTDLTRWAKQGVFLLNTALTVEEGIPGSHATMGWEGFTDFMIQTISEQREHVVFMLWGKHAQSKKRLIDAEKHLILEAPHPSPLSAYRGFFGCQHFSQANEYLIKHTKTPILW